MYVCFNIVRSLVTNQKKINWLFDLLHTFVGVVSLRCPSPLHSTNAVRCCISGRSMALCARFDRLAWNQTPNNWLASHTWFRRFNHSITEPFKTSGYGAGGWGFEFQLTNQILQLTHHQCNISPCFSWRYEVGKFCYHVHYSVWAAIPCFYSVTIVFYFLFLEFVTNI